MSSSDDSSSQLRSSSSTPNQDECVWVIAQIPAHALRALDPDESDRLETHLLRCRECDQEVAALRNLTGLLGAAVPQVDPPSTIRANLLAAVNAPFAPAQNALEMIPTSSTRKSRRAIPRARRWSSGRSAIVPLIVGLLLLSIWTADTHRSLGDRSDEVARLQRENEALTIHLSSIQVGQQVLGNSGIWYPLSGVNGSDSSAGGIMLSGQTTTATLLSVWNMPAEYDSFHIVCESKLGEMLAAGEIKVNENGNGSVTLELPAPVSEYRAVHVVPTNLESSDGNSVSNDILQLLLGDPTVVAPVES